MNYYLDIRVLLVIEMQIIVKIFYTYFIILETFEKCSILFEYKEGEK